MEKLLIGVMLRSVKSYNLVVEHINPKRYNARFKAILEKITEYYARDKTAESIHIPTFLAQLQVSHPSEKIVAELVSIVEQAVSESVSVENIEQVVLLAKKQEIRDELAIALTNGKDNEELHDEYRRLLEATTLDQVLQSEIKVVEKIDVLAWATANRSREGLLKLYPESLNNRLDGGMGGGDHGVIFARPEAGKTAFVINSMCGFARQGAPGIYFGNEDRLDRLEGRVISNLSGMTRQQIYDYPDRALDLSRDAGLDFIKMIEFYPGTFREMEEAIEKYEPQWIIVDQLRNLAVKADNRVLQLEKAAFGVRNLAKKYNLVALSVTQAGDSADGKAVLEMGDIDWSNTGIQAQADLMIGIGVNDELESNGTRVLSLPKNKLSGLHESFPVRIIPTLSRYASV